MPDALVEDVIGRLAERPFAVVGGPEELAGLRRPYVCLTRAVTSLVILHEQPLPAELSRG